jgi:hypothetical protein
MPICEADPWRLQYFDGIPCPEDVRIPTEDADAWSWYPKHRWVYDKLKVAMSQGLAAAPHGVDPPSFPVFSKPITNLKGMSVGSRVLKDRKGYDRWARPGHLWMELLEGEHVSTDVAVEGGAPAWWRHATGLPLRRGMFDYWTIHAGARPALESYLGDWIRGHMEGYCGLLNFETIGGRIIETHLRFADQWPDLYGRGWVEAAIGLYGTGRWRFADAGRRTGYSVALFGRHGIPYRHPRPRSVASVRRMPRVESVQITFHEDKPAAEHAMPPGGFRLAIVNSYDLNAARAARAALARSFPKGSILSPSIAAG